MAKIWKIGGREISLTDDVPQGVAALENYRIPAAGILSADPQAGREALDLFRKLGGTLAFNADLKQRDVQTKVFDRLNSAFLRKEIVAFNRQAQGGASTQGGSATSGNNQSSQGSPPPASNDWANTTTKKTWVDVQLLDDNGDPVAGERYILKLTDGSVREGTLGEDGRVRVAGIDPGNCVVSFPDIHTKEWWRKS